MGIFSRRARPAAAPRPRPMTFRPRLEAMEDRTVPSGGALDTTFNGTGVEALPSSALKQAFATSVQPDGKVVTVGRVVSSKGVDEIGVVRLNRNGSFDTTFNNTGTVGIQVGLSSSGTCVALQPDGKILVGSHPIVWQDKWNVSNYDSEYAVVRLNANGTLDTSFGNVRGGGIFTYNPTSGKEEVHSLAVMADGSIIADGQTGPVTGSGNSFSALKLTPAGVLDTRFGSGGRTVVHLTPSGLGSDNTYDGVGGVAVVPGTNQVVMVGNLDTDHPAAVVVLTSAGQLDTSFNGTGYRLDIPTGAVGAGYNAVAIQPLPTGGYSIVAAGSAHLQPQNSYSALAARYSLAGSLDTTFGGAGTGYYFRTDGVTVAGTGPLSGYLTTSSGPMEFADVSVAKDGSLVLGGSQYYSDAATGNTYTALAVGHLSLDGVLDTTFGTNAGFTYSTQISGLGGPGRLALDPIDGGIVVCGGGGGVGAKVLRFTAP